MEATVAVLEPVTAAKPGAAHEGRDEKPARKAREPLLDAGVEVACKPALVGELAREDEERHADEGVRKGVLPGDDGELVEGDLEPLQVGVAREPDDAQGKADGHADDHQDEKKDDAEQRDDDHGVHRDVLSSSRNFVGTEKSGTLRSDQCFFDSSGMTVDMASWDTKRTRQSSATSLKGQTGIRSSELTWSASRA